jgi:hypothetical protein
MAGIGMRYNMPVHNASVAASCLANVIEEELLA